MQALEKRLLNKAQVLGGESVSFKATFRLPPKAKPFLLSDTKSCKRFVASEETGSLISLERKLYGFAKLIWAELDRRKKK